VKTIQLSPTGDFRARVTIDIDKTLKLPDDTSASILTQGVLGSQYIGLEPGGSETLLPNGGEIAYTQSAVVIERLIGRVIQSLGNSSSSTPAPAPTPSEGGGG
jgi:phospholipid/cholesterol/gamma-HCH transport system substrate-binding protein